ncbi:AAA family ATPase [Leptolyngbya sp. DQ-M1]|uniref:AAA family ATPase n=1 Tax=Leptolyngbya sp. DQ-M1 TaxID=2933920 RepID=UPI003299D00C
MSELFKGFEQLLELAKLLEEKAEKGEIKANVQVNRAAFSSIPRNTGIGVSRPQPAQPSAPEVVITPPPANPVSLQNIGGLGDVLKELRELVELPLKRPEVLEKLGLEPPRGVLLTGSPGTGKTLTARSLADELGVNYIAIAAPEVMGKYYGEAEARLRSIFEKAAASAPCIVFIDEIDSLAPDRAKVEGEVEKRVVAQLLTLMDGFAQTKGVIVLAATNRPDHLDPALRRPGRFDREIQFRVPDRSGRLEILKILTRSMPLNSVDLDAIADLTVGMVGADLKAVCQKAAYTALRRQVPSLEAVPNELMIEQTDFLQALKEIKPSVLRSVEVESPNVSWEQIGGLEDIKRTLQEAVEGAMLYPELYQRTGAKAPRGILLWGLPGTGKTLLAKAVASQARANFIAVNGAELMSRWVGAAEQEVRDLFSKARQASPCVVFIDEIDTLAPVRGKFSGDSGVSDRVVGQLLTELDGLQDCGTVLLIGATNRPDELDPALLRAGRLDLQIQVSLPDQSSRLEILRVHNADRPLAEVDLDVIAHSTEGWNGADLALLSNQAALQAVRRYRALGMSEPTDLQITGEDFAIAYQALLSQRR